MKKYIALFVFLLGLWACSTKEIEVYTSERYLYFPDSTKGLDTAMISFTHHPGATTLEVPFYVGLTGPICEQPLEYKLIVVDSLTTADPTDYDIPTGLKFAAGKNIDIVNITIKNVRPELLNKSVYVTFRIAENENFKPGLYNQQEIKISFNNIKSKPLWWTGNIERILLGEYSHKKYEYFVIATGVTDMTDMDLAAARVEVIKFKRYLIANNIMEEDGVTPMVNGVPGR